MSFICIVWHRITILIQPSIAELVHNSRAACCPLHLLRKLQYSHGLGELQPEKAAARSCGSLQVDRALAHCDSKWVFGSRSTTGDNSAANCSFGFTAFFFSSVF